MLPIVSSFPFQDFTSFSEAFRQRRLAVLFDNSIEPHRAIMVCGASSINEPLLNEMISTARGNIYVTVSPERAESLLLVPLPEREVRLIPQRSGCAYVSVEAREGVTTGISVADRVRTIRISAEDGANPRRLVRPGHIFPIGVINGGALVKNSLPEGAHDLAQICNGEEGSVFSDLLTQDGDLPSAVEIARFCQEQDVPALSLESLVRYRLETEQLVSCVAESHLPTDAAGDLRLLIFHSTVQPGEHVALVKGDLSGSEPILTRVQRESTLSDVFGGSANSSRECLLKSLVMIGRAGRGVIVYLRSRDVGIESNSGGDKPTAALPSGTLMRQYGLGAQILRHLGVKRISLLTGSPKSLAGLTTFGIEIVSQIQFDGA